MSRDEQIKVGCIIVKDENILSMGYNGTPSGMDNKMRDEEGNSLPHVVHSEQNALMKLAKGGGNAEGSTLYTTHSPCWTCAKLIIQAGIRRVVYRRVYDVPAVDFLINSGVHVESIWNG